MSLPDVYYGEVKPQQFTSADVPDVVGIDDDDDEELAHTPSAVVEMLGFDPIDEPA